jgi:hypothetical protein
LAANRGGGGRGPSVIIAAACRGQRIGGAY